MIDAFHVLQEHAGGITPPHIDDISEKDQIGQEVVIVERAEEGVERGLVTVRAPQMNVRDHHYLDSITEEMTSARTI